MDAVQYEWDNSPVFRVVVVVAAGAVLGAGAFALLSSGAVGTVGIGAITIAQGATLGSAMVWGGAALGAAQIVRELGGSAPDNPAPGSGATIGGGGSSGGSGGSGSVAGGGVSDAMADAGQVLRAVYERERAWFEQSMAEFDHNRSIQARLYADGMLSMGAVPPALAAAEYFALQSAARAAAIKVAQLAVNKVAKGGQQLGQGLKNVREITSGRLKGFSRGNTELPGGTQGAKDLFKQLTGNNPKGGIDRIVLDDGREVLFRGSSKSGPSKIEVVNPNDKFLEKISFPE